MNNLGIENPCQNCQGTSLYCSRAKRKSFIEPAISCWDETDFLGIISQHTIFFFAFLRIVISKQKNWMQQMTLRYKIVPIYFLQVVNYVIEKMVLDKPVDSMNADGAFAPGMPGSQISHPAVVGDGSFWSGLKPRQKLKPCIEILCNNQVCVILEILYTLKNLLKYLKHLK